MEMVKTGKDAFDNIKAALSSDSVLRHFSGCGSCIIATWT